MALGLPLNEAWQRGEQQVTEELYMDVKRVQRGGFASVEFSPCRPDLRGEEDKSYNSVLGISRAKLSAPYKAFEILPVAPGLPF